MICKSKRWVLGGLYPEKPNGIFAQLLDTVSLTGHA